MNLRNEQVPLMCMVDGTKVEDLFKKEVVATSYNAALESAEFKEALKTTLEDLKETVKELQEMVGQSEHFKELISEESVLDNVRANVISNAISQAAEAIIFDGKNPETAVSEIITPSFVVELLKGLAHVIRGNCERHAFNMTISNAVLEGFEELFS